MKKLFSILLAVMLALGTVACGGAGGNSRREVQYNYGMRYVDDWETRSAAISAFRKAVGLQPKNEEYYIALADACYRDGYALQAVELLKLGIKNTKGNTVKEKLIAIVQEAGRGSQALEFDDNYNLIKDIDTATKSKEYTAYEYDENNQLVKSYDSDNYWYEIYEYDSENNVTITHYFKNVLSRIEKYDLYWNMLAYEKYNSNGTVDYAHYYEYDEYFNNVKSTNLSSSGDKRVVENEFNKNGFATKIDVFTGDEEKWEATREYEYDKNCNVTKQVHTTESEVKTFLAEYNKDNQLIELKRYSGEEMNLEYTEKYEYDSDGDRTTYSYDKDGNLTGTYTN